MSNYYRITSGLNSIGKLISENENPYNYITDDKDHYLSIYSYNEDQKKLAEEIIEKDGRQRPRGVSGIEDVKTNHLVFDIDNESNLQQAKEDTVRVYEKLIERGIDSKNILISFSGNKGFSLVVKHDTMLTPGEHKTIALRLAKEAGVTVDSKVYNPSRIFRLNFTKHQETGLYKTPVSIGWLKNYSTDFIKKQALNKPKSIEVKTGIQKLPQTVLSLKNEAEITKKQVEIVEASIDFTKKPFYLTDAKFVLHKGYIPKGWGNEGMMILCSTYRNAGFDKTDAYHMLKGVNEKRSELYGLPKKSNDEIWIQIVNTVYSPAWRGGMYSEKENDLLQLIVKEHHIKEKTNLTSIDNVSERFLHFAENINQNIVKTGIRSLDDNLLVTTGMMVGLLGAPSSGKTAAATKILETTLEQGQRALFLSLDMHDNLLFQRLIQRQTGVNVSNKLRKMIKSDKNFDVEYNIRQDKPILEGIKKVSEVYKNAKFNFTRGATIESIEEDIKINKQLYGEELKLVVVDYLEKVRGPYSDPTANSGFVASRLSDLASTYDVCIILILQPQKSAGDPSEELLSMRNVKGASVIEQDCRIILTLWRPGFNPKNPSDDKYSTIAIVKNNMGELLTLDYGFDGLKGQFNELTQPERDHLEELRQRVKEEKQAQKKEDW
jgi:replicative DNA helicase